MRQGTTPTYTLTIAGYDLTDKTVYVTISGSGTGRQITKTNESLTIAYENDISAIVFSLSQQDTFALPIGDCDVQVRFIDEHGEAHATDTAKIHIDRVLLPGVITYEGDDSDA